MGLIALACLLLLLLLSLVFLYDQITKGIPTRLDSQEAPKSRFELVPVGDPNLPARAGGVDIVFVHGLGSNPDTTWRAKRPAVLAPAATACITENTMPESGHSVNWVNDFLFDDLPPRIRRNTRMFYYNYDSYWKRDAVQTRLENLGKGLLEHIRGIRRTKAERSRDLTFVGYSYGGLVVKQALVQAQRNRDLNHINRDLNQIAEHTRAILFLGTPHHGSSFSRWGWWAAQALRPLGANPSILAGLDCNSLPLFDLHSDFMEITRDEWYIFNFFEQRPTQLFRLWSIQWRQFCVREQFSTYHGPKVRNIGLSVDHSGLNKFATRNENYQTILSKLVEVTIPQAHILMKHHYVVPLERVHSYTERAELSTELEQKLQIKHEKASVPYGVTLRGLGGTGKSQLALDYSQKHKDRYNPILWIDATDQEAVRSSFRRCAAELGLPEERAEKHESVLTDGVVQAVLRWLRDRSETDDEWLMIVDNADDVSWGIQKIMPKGVRGRLIITSQDEQSTFLLPGCEQICVGIMSPEEGVALLLKRLRLNTESVPERVQHNCNIIAKKLGYLALAIDLVGAYLGNDSTPEQALSQYLIDYDRHRDELLQMNGFQGLLPTQKTVWTVWDTTFEKITRDYFHLRPALLLAFLAQFKGSIVQDEMFRLASLGIATVDAKQDNEADDVIPANLRHFLIIENGEWDSFRYRQSRDVLVRYSLLQRVEGQWPGVTMHGLVQWRATQYENDQRWGRWYSMFVLAACCQVSQKHKDSRFRRHLLVHIPEVTQDWMDCNKLGGKIGPFMQSTFRRIRYIRHEELFHIHKALTNPDGSGIAVLCGLGGIGKTQLARAYADLHGSDYSDIFWLDADSEDSVNASYAEIAKTIVRKYPSASEFGTSTADSAGEQTVIAVKQWLRHPVNSRWLMICDNFNGLAQNIRQLLPIAKHGSIIIATRSIVDIGCQIHVRNLGIAESLEILSDTTRRETTINDPAAADLAKELDGHPLALAMVGAYIRNTESSYADFLSQLKAPVASVVKPNMELSLSSAFKLSFERVKQENGLCAKLLQLWAYFDHQDLWLELLREGAYGGLGWLCELTMNKLDFEEVVGVLSAYGLVKANGYGEDGIESEGYWIHNLLHKWTVDVLNEKWDVKMAGRTLDWVASHIPVRNSPNSWAIRRRLLRHAARGWWLVKNGLADSDSRSRALHTFGDLYAEQGKYGEAEEMLQRASQGYDKALGPIHPSTLSTVNDLGLLYMDQGHLDKAEKMCQRALQGFEGVLGPDHPSTLSAVHNLGLLYADQGRLGDAEKMFERTLKGYRQTFGPEDLSSLSTVNKLGLLYRRQGHLHKAEKMCDKALHGYEKVLGPDHPSTLSAVDNLGLLYMDQGHLDKAEKMCQRALQGYEQALGPDHPSTLNSMANLACTWQSQGRHAEAWSLMEKCLQRRQRILGPKHPHTLSSEAVLTRWRDSIPMRS